MSLGLVVDDHEVALNIRHFADLLVFLHEGDKEFGVLFDTDQILRVVEPLVIRIYLEVFRDCVLVSHFEI